MKQKNSFIQIGEKMDVFLGKGDSYRTKLEDITLDGYLVISTPIHRGLPVILHKDQVFELYYYRENGRYCFEVIVKDFIMQGALRMIVAEALSPPQKEQRRTSFRLQAARDVRIRRMDDGIFPEDRKEDDGLIVEGKTLNISETGAAVHSKTELRKGERIYIRLALKWPEERTPPVEFIAEVVQSFYIDEKKVYQLGVRFLDLSETKRAHLAKFILAEQQNKIRLQRYVTEGKI